MNAERTQPQVFISYARQDVDKVLPIARLLEARGVTVWRDGDRILGGQYYGEQIVHAIAHSRVLMVMCSPQSFVSDNVHREVLLTWDYYHRLYLPVWLGPAADIPDRFRYCLVGCQWVDAHSEPTQAWLPKMLQALESLGVETAASQSKSAAAPPSSRATAPSRNNGLRFKPGDRPIPGADWELVQLLGKGGFGEVWKAHNPQLPSQRAVALKFCMDLDKRSRDLLWHEADMVLRVQGAVRDEGIVPLLHAYLNNDPPCLEYPYIEGGTLVGLMEEARQSGAPLSAAKVQRIMLRIAQIVRAAHRSTPILVHRDIKPANILVERTSDRKFVLRVTDFGIGGVVAQPVLAKSRSSRSLEGSMASVLTGAHTPLYASPQQIRGDRPDPREDVYALGVVWYQLLTGDLTSPAPTGRKWVVALRQRGVTPEAIKVLASCFESDPTHRPADAGALADLLQKLPTPAASAAHPVLPVALAAGPKEVVYTDVGRDGTLVLPVALAPPAAVPAAPPVATLLPPTAFGREEPAQAVPLSDSPSPPPGQAQQASLPDWIGVPPVPLPPPHGSGPTTKRSSGSRKAGTSPAAETLVPAPEGTSRPDRTVPAKRQPTSRPAAPASRRLPRRAVWIAAAILLVLAGLGYGGWSLYAAHQSWSATHDLTQRVDDLTEVSENDQALNLCNEAVRWDPSSASYSERSRVYTEMKEYDKAIADLDAAVRLAPDNALAFARRGRVYAMKKDFDRAFTDCDHAVNLNPKLDRAYVNRALVLKQKNNLTQAIQDMDEAVRLEPNEGNYYSRGEFYSELDADKAIDDFNESIRIKPKAYAYANRAYQYFCKADSDLSYQDLAVSDCTEALRLDPKSANAFGIRGAVRYLKKKYDQAEQDLTEAIRLDRQYGFAYRFRGLVYLDQKKYEPAARDFQAAADLKGDQWWYDQNNAAAAWFGLAKEYLAQGKDMEARQANDRSLEFRSDVLTQRPWWVALRWSRSKNYQFKGECWEKSGNLTFAAESYQKASDEGSQEASNKLADLYEKGTGVDQDLPKAARLREKAAGQAMFKFKIPCLIAGYSKPFPFDVYVTTPLDDDIEDPLQDEAKRLKEDHNAALPDALWESCKKQLRIARDKDESYTDLVYPVMKAYETDKDDKPK